MKAVIEKYLELEKDIDKINLILKQRRDEKEILGHKISAFCKSINKSTINLPDGSSLKLCKNTKYQSLSYSMLEENLNKFIKAGSSNIDVKEFMKFIKTQRDATICEDMRHL